MIRVVQCQHDGSFLVIAWDPGILWVDSLAAGTDGRTLVTFRRPLVLAHCRTVLWAVGALHLSDWFGTRGSSLVSVWFSLLFLWV
jgi:hypothetical protein